MSNHVDLEEIVLRWAKVMFKTTSKNSKTLSKLSEEELDFRVDWRRVHFKHGDPEFKDAVIPETPGSQVLFQTEFTNRTDQEQEYAFKAERTTRSTCEVVIEKGVTTGHELAVSIKTPCEVFEANAGFHREISCNNIYGQTVEEELTWGVDNTIKVPKKHKAHASLVISESKYDAKFVVHSSAQGKVVVKVYNPRENNCWVQDIMGNLADIVRAENPKNIEVKKNKLKYETEGSCNFRFGVKQHVEVSQEELPQE
jgi:hypothetical protein